MYLKFDLAGPVMTEWVNTTSFKRKVIREWPKKYVDGHYVFSDLLAWDKWTHAYDYPKLYKALGITKEQINENNYDGLKEFWFVMHPWQRDVLGTITDVELADLLNEHLTLDTEYTAELRYETSRESTYGFNGLREIVPPDVTNASILNLMAGGYDTIPDYSTVLDNHILVDGVDPVNTTEGNSFLFAALADNQEEIFERKFRVTGRTVVESTSTESITADYDAYPTKVYKTSIEIQVRYTRKVNARDHLSANMFTSFFAKLDELEEYKRRLAYEDDYTINVKDKQKPPTDGFIFKQIQQLIEVVRPIASDDLFYIKTVPGFENVIINDHVQTRLKVGTKFIKVSGVESMTGREFVKFFGNAFGSRYTKEDVPWYVKALNVLIVFIAFFFAIPTAGGSLAAVLGGVATAIAIGLAVQYAFGMFLQAVGNLAGAMYTLKMTTFLGNITKFLGYITMISGAVTTGISGFIKTVTTSPFQAFKTVSSWINTGLDIYNNITTKDYAKKLANKKKEVDELEAEMEDLTSPKAMTLIQQYFENYEWAEVNAVSDNVPYMLTQGKIDLATTKYYD